MTEVIDGLPNDAYHARPELGSTSVKLLAHHPPAVYAHRKDNPEPPKTAYDIGTVAHSVILENSWDGVDVIDVDDKRGKKWSDPADLARAAGKTPLTSAEALTIADMARAVKMHPIASELLTGHVAERSYFTELHGVPVKARPDALNGNVVVDLKTTAVDLGGIERQIATLGYHVQEAHYTDVLRACGQTVEDFMFIFVSTQAPHLVRVIRLEGAAVDLGREQQVLALETYRHCAESNHWPGYEGIDALDLPTWVYSQQADEEMEIVIP